MCGICGKLQLRDGFQVEQSLVNRMMDAIAHRGPDGRGSYLSGPVGLGHTRLSIIDLNTGAQPMCNEDKTVWIVFNGEIYNFPELRDQLSKRGHIFSSATDTEVIIHLYEEYGVKCLQYLRGMFAFAIWDEKDRSLFLARDRVGIKPLYYVNTGRSFVFGSEIKALLADPEVNREIELQSIDTFLTHFCLPGCETLWKGINKLGPGEYLLASKGTFSIRQYWDLRFQPSDHGSLEEASERTYDIVKKTVRDHMISDVPVGFLLSGGVDSTVVLACAAAETSKRISTFTVGFDNADFEDERTYARLASKYFNSDHHEISFTPQQFWDFLPKLIWHMEEPVCDPPAVSLHYISQLAAQHVTVLLSGEGGDEAFGGYNSYRNFGLLERVKAAMGPLSGIFSSALEGVSHIPPMRRFRKMAPYFRTTVSDYYYSRTSSPFTYFNRHKSDIYSSDLCKAVSSDRSLKTVRDLYSRVIDQPTLHQMQYLDTKTSLPEDLLIKADRITMANSLELRVPFLDHELLEFAASLPLKFKVNLLSTKRILKDAFGERIPRQIITRKKAGFPLPLNRWLRNDLKDEIGETLLSSQFLSRGYFNKIGIEILLKRFRDGDSLGKEVFSLLTLELLFRQFSAK
jgi:asparagine synthase (glutamine-hydrolysing)